MTPPEVEAPVNATEHAARVFHVVEDVVENDEREGLPEGKDILTRPPVAHDAPVPYTLKLGLRTVVILQRVEGMAFIRLEIIDDTHRPRPYLENADACL